MKKSIISFFYPHWNTLLDDSCSMALHVISGKLCHLLQRRKDFLTLINCVWSNMSFGKNIIAIIRKGGYKTVEIYHKWPTRTGRKYTTYGKRKVLFHSDLNFRVSIPLKPTQIFFFFFLNWKENAFLLYRVDLFLGKPSCQKPRAVHHEEWCQWDKASGALIFCL